jgi:signal transduction histidine kinase
LRPPTLDDLGLIPSLAAYLEDFKKRTGIRVRFTAYPGVEQLGSVSRVTFFRVAQSALSNVVLHAKASRVAVRIQQRPQAACMEIEDDGIGFEPNGGPLAKAARRLGLLGMKERMGMVGGTFTVESAPGHGTVVRAEIPVMKGKQVTKTQVRS